MGPVATVQQALPPFLKKIGIALRDSEDFLKRVGGIGGSQTVRRRLERLPGQLSRGGAAAQLEKGGVQRPRERRRKGSVFGGFDQHGRETALLGVEEDSVQENRFSDPAQADHEKTFGRKAGRFSRRG